MDNERYKPGAGRGKVDEEVARLEMEADDEEEEEEERPRLSLNLSRN